MKQPSRKKNTSRVFRNLRDGAVITTRLREKVDQAIERIRLHARREPAQRARGSQLIERVRQLIESHPRQEWSEALNWIERQVVEVKFGFGGSGDVPDLAELSNPDVATKLNISKQMVAYHLKNVVAKLEKKFGSGSDLPEAADPRAERNVANTEEADKLRDDKVWQKMLRWWRARRLDDSPLTGEDLGHLQELERRLASIAGPEEKKSATDLDKNPGRQYSPERYHELRKVFVEKPDLLELLTPRQREVMTTGLALEVKQWPLEGELGFRLFLKRDAMTKQNFNYFVREVIRRLKLEL